jgi:hypothetical protein
VHGREPGSARSCTFNSAITLFSTVILLIYMGTFRQMAGFAADPVVQLGLVRNPSPVVHAVLAPILLLIATWLAVYKPFGVTPYARRINRQGLGVISAAAVPPSAIPPNSATGDTHLGVCHRLCRTRGDARGRAPALERYQLRPLAAQTVLTSRGAVRQAAGMSRMNRGSVCR